MQSKPTDELVKVEIAQAEGYVLEYLFATAMGLNVARDFYCRYFFPGWHVNISSPLLVLANMNRWEPLERDTLHTDRILISKITEAEIISVEPVWNSTGVARSFSDKWRATHPTNYGSSPLAIGYGPTTAVAVARAYVLSKHLHTAEPSYALVPASIIEMQTR